MSTTHPKTSPDGVYIVMGRGYAPRYNSIEKEFNCSLCGEPWDFYGVRNGEDMTYADARRFLRGEGCPSCQFGTHDNFLFIEQDAKYKDLNGG